MYPQPYLEGKRCSPPCVRSHYANFGHHVLTWPVFKIYEWNYRVYIVFVWASFTQVMFMRCTHGVNCSGKFSLLFYIKLYGYTSIYLFVLLLLDT